MPIATEALQIGQRQSLADLIANIEAQATPYTSLIQKRERPKQIRHQWQVKAYPVTGHRGVLDGKDATGFQSNPRAGLTVVAQKTWYLPGVSDFAEETEVAGVPAGEMSEQVADALVSVKRQIEKRCMSSNDNLLEAAPANGNETRGAFSYVSNTAQALYPIDSSFRTPAAQVYTGTLDAFDESVLLGMCRSSYKQRKGPFKMDAFLGIDLKAKFTMFSDRMPTPGNNTVTRRFNQDAGDKTFVNVIDKLVLDTGEVDLHPHSFLVTDADSGEDTANTHSSGLIVDLDMCGLAYMRLPRVLPLENKGGGPRAIVDSIFLHMMDNVLGAIAINATP